MDSFCVIWHEIKFEKKKASEEQALLLDLEVGEEFDAYNCEMPGDDERVLITTRWGSVEIDTFHEYDTFGFEDYSDPDDVIAWAELPEPWRKKDGD